LNDPEQAHQSIPIIQPRASFEELRAETEKAVLRVLASGDYILGSEVDLLETEIADYLDVPHAIGVSSGTEALLVALQDLEIGPGDEVITPCFTFIATATAVTRLGAKPVFVDVDAETYQMSPDGVRAAINERTRAIIPVHLYGHPAPMEDYLRIVAEANHPIAIVEDAAQAIGTTCRIGKKLLKAGTGGLWGCFSFYPTKNLPACGEAGLMVTADSTHADRARRLRNHGQVAPYRHGLLGGNARLDGVQAAILRVRLRHLEEWNERRRQHAREYDRLFAQSGLLSRREIRLPPKPRAGEVVNYHQYTIGVPRRDELKAYLSERQIQTGVYYPMPLSEQPLFSFLGHKAGDFPAAERAAREVLSLPVHQHLDPGNLERVVAGITEFYGR
jgi:dTDP-4-amino-4,6-dideoxygalactose transaminase